MKKAIKGIMIYKKPRKVTLGQWVMKHPECDSICERRDTSPEIYIHAYSKSESHNSELKAYRDRYLPDKVILRGIPADGLNCIV